MISWSFERHPTPSATKDDVQSRDDRIVYRKLGLSVFLVLLLGVTSVAVSAAAGTAGTVTSATVAGTYGFDQLFTSGNGLFLSESSRPPGDPVDGPCGAAAVSASTLAASKRVPMACDDPAAFGSEAVVPYSTGWGSGYTKTRISRLDPSTGKVTLGPVLFDVEDTSGSSPIWAYGAGYLWLYELEAGGSSVFQISEQTGEVVRTFAAPKLVRPLAAANDNGFYLAGTGSFGGVGTGLIYFFGANANSVKQVFTVPNGSQAGEYSASWLLAEGNAVWSDICPRLAKSCQIWGFRGPDLQPQFHVSDHGDTGEWITGSAEDGFFTSFPLKFEITDPLPTTVKSELVRIDPTDGSVSRVATLQLPPFWSGAGVIDGGSLLMFPSTELVRVSV